jgi:hypothetical protein
MKKALAAVLLILISGWLLTEAKANAISQASGQPDVANQGNSAVIAAREYSN